MTSLADVQRLAAALPQTALEDGWLAVAPKQLAADYLHERPG